VKSRLLLIVIAMMAMFSACTCESVKAGEVGIIVNTMGSDRGDLVKVGVGRYTLSPYQDLYKFPTFKQSVTWTTGTPDESISFQTVEGLTVNSDVGITFSIDESKVIDLFRTYRKGVSEIADTYLRAHVRDALVSTASTMSVEAVYGAGKAKLFDDVQTQVAAKVAPLGIIVENVYVLNEIRLPKSVVDALNAKASATQRAQQAENELRQTEAEAKKAAAAAEGKAQAILIEAQAQAKANDLLAKSITPTLVEMKRIEKWDGKMPVATGGSTLLDLRDGGGK
jgi:regulator of protease activity HflC (stomatin/prohibitin superfamily)